MVNNNETEMNGEEIAQLRVLMAGEHFPSSIDYMLKRLEVLNIPRESILLEWCKFVEVERRVKDYHILIPSMLRITKEIMDKGENLKAIIQYGTGLEGVDIPAATERGIHVSNIPAAQTANGSGTAEHAVYLLLSAMRQPDKARQCFQNERLGSPLYRQLQGKIITVFGFGGVGKEVVKKLLGFGISRINVVKNSPATEEDLLVFSSVLDFFNVELNLIQKSDQEKQDRALGETDALILACVLNDSTRGLVNAEFLAKCKKGLVVVNIARGALVVNEAMLDGLNKKNGLDVSFFASDVGCSVFRKELTYPAEPFPPYDPLAIHSNSFFTPHTAAVGDVSYESMAAKMVDHFISVKRCGRPTFSVNSLG